jgi:AraC-like DNA-binding protein
MLDALEAVATRHDAGVEIERHAHPEGQLTVVLCGTAAITSAAGWLLAPPGFGIWVPPNVEHQASYSEASELINLRLPAALGAPLGAQCRSVMVSDLLRELAREAATVIANDRQDPALPLFASLIVHQASRPVLTHPLFVPDGQDRRLKQATAILRRHPEQRLRLEVLAAQVHTSSRTLARLFVAETGMTFGRWCEHLRVVSAVEQLCRGKSILQTALDLGYQSASSFTSLFTRLLGVPPRRYLRQLRAEER